MVLNRLIHNQFIICSCLKQFQSTALDFLLGKSALQNLPIFITPVSMTFSLEWVMSSFSLQ